MAYLASMLGSLFGGFFVGLAGIRNYYLVIGAAIGTALLLYALSFVFGQKVLKIPLPDNVRSTHRQLQLEQEREEQEQGA